MDKHSSPAEKIALFRALFRGRADVYPRRFESRKTGRAGYSPVCGNEWVKGICEKPRIKCTECSHQNWLGVTDEVVHNHLVGKIVIGVYPMLLDESCFFLAVDFDGSEWAHDVRAFMETCGRWKIPVALERSRSGEGGHVWFFFDEAIPATLARKLGASLLTETMEGRPGIGLKSYDRFFPNQDTLPRGGFGNLIALPLQKRARDCGNTEFLDANFVPFTDQWAFLAAIPKISRPTTEERVSQAESRGRVVGVRVVLDDEEKPWTTPPSQQWSEMALPGPLPEKLEAVLADQIYFSKAAVPPPLRNRLVRLAAFQNPEFYRAQAMRLPVYDKPRIISCAEEYPDHFALPRGCLDDTHALLQRLGVKFSIRDERCRGTPLEVSFCGELRPEQEAAAEALEKHDFGVLAATTAFGKTVLAAWLIARRRVSTLVLVHRQQLLEQWGERLAEFLGVRAKSIGRLGGGRKKLTASLDIATIQSLVREGVVDDRVGDYGHLIVDECHHLSAHSFERVARRAKAQFFTGLSATVARKDGHHPIIFMQCGPVRHRIDARKQTVARPFYHKVIVRPTGFRATTESAPDPRSEYQDLVENLAANEARNQLICSDVIAAFHEGRSPLVLTERTTHLKSLAERLALQIPNIVILQGGMGRKALRAALARLGEGPRVVLATGRFVGEGFDDSRLDTLFLALPISWRGTISQYAGRLHRLHEGKGEVRIYDYADLDVPMLSRMFDKRCCGYEAIGYEILLPASAVPGWPVEVPLPVDPAWKKEYAASVRRLIRDGVTVSLADLFLHAARPFAPDAEGADRARSASEAFLFRRLETLSQTRGLFRLNAELPIPFDNAGKMEVDFLCAEFRLIIELDGSQHLGDAEAFRRDRRKDALLQRHRYFVLRFLAEDVGNRLDAILDITISTLVFLRERAASPP